MHLDVQDLRKFYFRTQLGRVAQGVMSQQLRKLWADTSAQTLIGFGFAAPLLRPYLSEARRVIALMPGPQGVVRWPRQEPNVSVLCEETLWPLQMGQADRLVMLHGLETCESPSALLEEAWRVLAPAGRACFIVPNRAGLWARRDATPFGYGRPYSLSQLETQLRAHSFTPEYHGTMLFSPPSHRRFWLRTSPAFERFGQRVTTLFAGGVLLVEATKQVYGPRHKGSPMRVRNPLQVIEGRPSPVAGRSM